mgnify:CR=1 FL=1
MYGNDIRVLSQHGGSVYSLRLMSPYRTVLIRASDGAAEAATDGWDVGPRAERARDRSFYPASGSGANGVWP